MAMSFIEVRWPVVDEDRTALELIAEAEADLEEGLPTFGLRAMSAPAYSWVSAPGPMRLPVMWLVARFAVTNTPMPVPAQEVAA